MSDNQRKRPDGTPCITDIKKWTAVATWAWDLPTENCAICRNNISDLCIECQGQPGNAAGECNVAWGQCNHAFHHHCISRWLKNRPVCPIDDREWEMSELKSNANT